MYPQMDCDEIDYRYIVGVYIISLVIWTLLIFFFGYVDDPGSYVLLLPYFLFLFAISNACYITRDVEEEIFENNYLTLGLLIALPLLTWMGSHYKGDKNKFVSIIIVAIIISILTHVDIWITRKWIPVYKHWVSALQTMSITLFVFALVNYYMCRI